jgi:hypothetical protein
VYNLGAGIVGPGTQLGSLLRARNFTGYATALLSYDHAGGVVLEGLRIRRLDEARLFLTPDTKPKPKPTPNEVRKTREKKLRRDIQYRNELRVLITKHHCRTIHGKKAYKACPVWAHNGQIANKQIHQLERE